MSAARVTAGASESPSPRTPSSRGSGSAVRSHPRPSSPPIRHPSETAPRLTGRPASMMAASNILTLRETRWHTVQPTARRSVCWTTVRGSRGGSQCRGSDRSRLRSAWYSSSRGVARPRPVRPPPPPPPASAPPAATASAPARPPPTPAASQGDKFKGVNVNILTFNGPQVAEPLQRRAPDWEQLTGGHVNVVAVGFQTIYDKALLDASTGTNTFDAYVFNPQWLGDFVGPGYLLDLTDRVNNDPQLEVAGHRPVLPRFQRDLQRQGLHDPARRRLPHGLLPQATSSTKDGVKPPATWDDYLDDRRRSTTARTSTATASPTTARASPRRRAPRATGGSSRSRPACSRAKGTEQGAFFDTTNMDPLFGQNEAMTKALETYKKTDRLRPARRAQHGRRRHPRPVHDRSLRAVDGLGRHRDPGPGHLRPGQDRRDDHARAGSRSSTAATGKLVPCDATTCPNAVDGVNYAPFASFGGWSGRGQRGRARRRSRTPPTPSCRT